VDKLSTADKVILGGGIAYLIFMFLPWYGIDVGNEFASVSYDNSGWDYFLGGILPAILILIMGAHVLIRAFSPDTKLPDLPVPWSQVHLIAGVAVAVILVLRTLIGSDDVGSIDTGVDLDRKIGLFLALIAAIVVAVGGYLKSQEGDVGPTTAGPDTGSAPF
jgi:hypothetical protein